MNLQSMPLDELANLLRAGNRPAVPWVILALVLAFGALRERRAARRTSQPAQPSKVRRRPPADDILTWIAASVATVVTATGMYQVFSDINIPKILTNTVFAFLELATLACAVRARANSRRTGQPGIDGQAVWVFTSLSAVFSSLDSSSLLEVLLRLAAPFVAAWLWHRGMAVEREAQSGHTGFQWRRWLRQHLTRLGWIDPTTRSNEHSDRALLQLADAAVRLRTAGRFRAPLLRWKLRRANRRALWLSDLSSNTEQRDQVVSHMTMLWHADALASRDLSDPWSVGASAASASLESPAPPRPADRQGMYLDLLGVLGPRLSRANSGKAPSGPSLRAPLVPLRPPTQVPSGLPSGSALRGSASPRPPAAEESRPAARTVAAARMSSGALRTAAAVSSSSVPGPREVPLGKPKVDYEDVAQKVAEEIPVPGIRELRRRYPIGDIKAREIRERAEEIQKQTGIEMSERTSTSVSEDEKQNPQSRPEIKIE